MKDVTENYDLITVELEAAGAKSKVTLTQAKLQGEAKADYRSGRMSSLGIGPSFVMTSIKPSPGNTLEQVALNGTYWRRRGPVPDRHQVRLLYRANNIVAKGQKEDG